MLIKFETKSNRVKGLSFHPNRPWILSSLHNGRIQLWDYRMGTLIDQYEEHEGPVRGVDFHKTQPLFVSGGDDYKVKIWNYKLRRCIHTFQGHTDYIRTVEFHPEQPWIVSCSDDFTVRIWNWQSRQCVATLSGHNHYVMSASFHPTDDLIVSASLDQSIRVWDISGLRTQKSSKDEFNMKMAQLNQDLFGNTDVMVKYILEGHEKGVNWAKFHPTSNLIVSAADDREIKLWRVDDTKAYEVDKLIGHNHNISCVMFHPKKDLIVSNSEDKSIRFWNLTKGTPIQTYQRDNDRFWILDVHPTQNLIAAGHDNGLMIFKLERERPAYYSIKGSLYYVKGKYLRRFNTKTNIDTPLAVFRSEFKEVLRGLMFNQQENHLLVTMGLNENATWELYTVPTNNGNDVEVCNRKASGRGLAAVFTSNKKYAVLDSNRQSIIVKNVDKGSSREVNLPVKPVDSIFQANSGRILLKSEDKVHLYDFEQQSIISSIIAPNVKYVIWSENMTRVALIGKHTIIIANSKLKQLCSVHETIRIKSGAFDDQGVFLYTTLNHMKYCLPSGDSGTIKTLEEPFYIGKVLKNLVHFIDRDHTVRLVQMDTTEYRFKMALSKGDLKEIKSIIGQSKILGDSIISYLQKKGYPQVALKFVEDGMSKFDLAIESGNIVEAWGVANKLDKAECWERLGKVAFDQGNYKIREACYQRLKDYDKLSFFYAITGNHDKLNKMLNIAELRENPMSVVHNTMYLGNIRKRVEAFAKCEQYKLAYITALSHGLTEESEKLKKILEASGENIPEIDLSESELLIPPTPISIQGNWPILEIEMPSIDDIEPELEEEDEEQDMKIEDDENDAWSKGLDVPEESKTEDLEGEDILESDGWNTFELEGMDEVATAAAGFSPPSYGKPLNEMWNENSNHHSDHIAAGSFETAMQILHQNFAIVEFEPLKDYFMAIYKGARAMVPINSHLPSLSIPLQRNLSDADNEDNKHNSLPLLANFSIRELTKRLQYGLDLVTKAKFAIAEQVFTKILHQLLFVLINTKKEEKEVKDMMKVAIEYITALRLELTRKTIKDDPARSAELAAYFTKCKLRSNHIMLSLLSAMTYTYKIENFLTASMFAKRLLKLSPNEKMSKQAKFVLKNAEKKQQNKYELNYDEKNPFVICSKSLTPIYSGSDSVQCGYCNASFLAKYNEQLCNVCGIGKIGKKDSIGFQMFKPIGSLNQSSGNAFL